VSTLHHPSLGRSSSNLSKNGGKRRQLSRLCVMGKGLTTLSKSEKTRARAYTQNRIPILKCWELEFVDLHGNWGSLLFAHQTHCLRIRVSCDIDDLAHQTFSAN
jgi:hypothetical protein